VPFENAHPPPVRVHGQDQLLANAVDWPLLQRHCMLALPQRGEQFALANLDRLRTWRLLGAIPNI
jgi:hypothetical protein